MAFVSGGQVRVRQRLGGLGQQRDDCGGCATSERYEGVESPGAYIDLNATFSLRTAFFLTVLPCSGLLSPEEGWDAVT